MIAARIVRRFNVRDNTGSRLVELARVCDVPAVPYDRMILVFEDGAEVSVAGTRMHAWASPREPGVYPGLEIKMASEPADKLEGALAAGWAPVSDV